MSKLFDDAFSGFGTSSAAGAMGFDPLTISGWGDPIETGGIDLTGAIPGIPRLPTEVDSGFGNVFDKGRLALSGLATIGNLWAAFQSQKLAKKQFNYTKKVTNANLGNQIKSYNTTLEDRSRSRAAVEGQSPEMAQSYIDKTRLASFGG